MPIIQTILISLSICGVSGWLSFRLTQKFYRRELCFRQADLNGWMRIADDRLTLAIKFAGEVAELNKRLAKFDHRNRLRNSKGKFLSTTRKGN